MPPLAPGSSATPLAALQGAPGVWRLGPDLLHIDLCADLPDRCVCCNAAPARRARVRLREGDGRDRGTLQSALSFSYDAGIGQEETLLWLPLCRLHWRRQRLGRPLFYGALLLFLVLVALAAAWPAGGNWLYWTAQAAFVGVSLTAWRWSTPIRMLRYSDDGCTYRVNPAYAATFLARVDGVPGSRA